MDAICPRRALFLFVGGTPPAISHPTKPCIFCKKYDEFSRKRFICITFVENERVFMNRDELYLRKIHFVKGGFKWKKQ